MHKISKENTKQNLHKKQLPDAVKQKQAFPWTTTQGSWFGSFWFSSLQRTDLHAPQAAKGFSDNAPQAAKGFSDNEWTMSEGQRKSQLWPLEVDIFLPVTSPSE